jgi:uncharacterized membrane protein YphA (DoxX/SURF4 family)
LLQRLFSTFPNGWPALGLLLLRISVGVAALNHGRYAFADPPAVPLWLGLLAIVLGASLIAGFATPIVAGLIALGTFSSAAFVAAVATAIVLLGPGACSIDARLYGRREILIPRKPSLSKF